MGGGGILREILSSQIRTKSGGACSIGTRKGVWVSTSCSGSSPTGLHAVNRGIHERRPLERVRDPETPRDSGWPTGSGQPLGCLNVVESVYGITGA